MCSSSELNSIWSVPFLFYSDSFLQFKGHAPPPRLASLLMFLLELLRRNNDSDPALLTLPLPSLLRCVMMVNEPQGKVKLVHVRTKWTELFYIVCNCLLFSLLRNQTECYERELHVVISDQPPYTWIEELFEGGCSANSDWHNVLHSSKSICWAMLWSWLHININPMNTIIMFLTISKTVVNTPLLLTIFINLHFGANYREAVTEGIFFPSAQWERRARMPYSLWWSGVLLHLQTDPVTRWSLSYSNWQSFSRNTYLHLHRTS